MPERLVVIGGDAAGMAAASQARKRRGPDDLEILAFERGNHTSYSACGIPYYVGHVVEDFQDLIVRTPEEFRNKQSIDVRIRHEVTEVDLGVRTVHVRDLDNEREFTQQFDRLVVATGATPLRPRLDGSDATGIFGVQVLDDGLAIEQFLHNEDPKRAVVVGGGYVGLEMAEALVERGLDVTLVERAPHPMLTLDEDMGGLVTDALTAIGVEVRVREGVTGFVSDGGFVTGVATDRGTIDTDLVVLGLGARPNSELAQRAGIPIGPSGGIKVDRRMRTEVDGVWAAGDCTEKFHLVSRKPVTIALGTHANKEGRVAGINIGGGYETFPGVVGTAVTKVCGIQIARTGLKEDEAAAAGFRYVSATVDSTTRAGYFPGAAPIKTKLIVELNSGRLLGAQIVGKEGAAKRIDVLAAALWNEMTVDEMLNMDLSYAPPFAPVWDPVLIAARKAWEKVEDNLRR
ncbi:MAG: FAD-dependent oxidoreductase [Actinomycetota bacterium]|nr:FAD-dependent oxidoreductase [Actinomycetota bacterium]